MRSVNNKTKELLLSTSSNDSDIIIITETWLHPDQCDNEFLDKKYKSYRRDRSDSDIEADRGGGVLIALKAEIDCDEYITPEMNGLEAVCVKANLSECSLYIYCLYIQPGSSLEVYIKHLTAIKSIEGSSRDIITIFGDWNLPKIRWSLNEEGFDFLPIIGESQCAEAQKAKHVTEFMLNNGLFQVCGLTNKSNNVLDLIFTNMPELTLVQKSDMPLIPESIQDDAHVLMSCFIECEPKSYNTGSDDRKIYCFKKGNYESINEFVDTINFSDMLTGNGLNEAVNEFYSTLYKIFDEFIPTSSLKINNKPPWFDNELATLKNCRNKEFKKLSRLRQLNPKADESLFLSARERFNECHSVKYDEYVRNMLANSKDDSKQFWKFINGKRSNNSLPCKLVFNEEIATDDAAKSRIFAKFFASVYTNYPNDYELGDFIENRHDANTFNINSFTIGNLCGFIFDGHQQGHRNRQNIAYIHT